MPELLSVTAARQRRDFLPARPRWPTERECPAGDDTTGQQQFFRLRKP